MNPVQQSALAQAMQQAKGLGQAGVNAQAPLAVPNDIPQNPGNPIINAAMQNGMNPGQPFIPQGAGGYGVQSNQTPNVQYPMSGGINPQGVSPQLLQHPQVQQALQTVGNFLAKIGHPLAQQFNALHGFGGQGVGMPQSIINATSQNYNQQASQGNVFGPVNPSSGLPQPSGVGGVPPVTMQQLGQAVGRKKK